MNSRKPLNKNPYRVIRNTPINNRVASKKKPYLDPSNWAGRMKDVPVFLMGNAPSLTDHNLSILDDYFTIGANRIFYVYDPTILVWQDLALWQQEKEKIKKCNSIKYSRQHADTEGGTYGFTLQGSKYQLTQDTKFMKGRGSSGSLLFQLAYVLGCNPIFLVGMDCCNRGNKTDFYGKNPMHKKHTLTKCEEALRFIKKIGDDSKKIKVVNCSDSKVFSNKISLEDAVAMCGDKKYNRETLEKMLLEGI